MIRNYVVTVNGTAYDVTVEEVSESAASAVSAPAPKAAPKKTAAPAAKSGAGTPVNAPMQGTVLKVAVTQGASVKKGDLLCVLEAMKMENEILSPCDGTVTSLAVAQGQSIATGALIATVG